MEEQPGGILEKEQPSLKNYLRQEPPAEKKQTNKWIIIGMSIILLTALGGTGIFFYLSNQQIKVDSVISPSPHPTEMVPTLSLSPTPNSTNSGELRIRQESTTSAESE